MDRTERKITKIAREASKVVLLKMKESNIGSGEFELVHLVRHNPGISQKEAGERLNMDKGAVARRVISLEKKGYITREVNPDDNRGRMLYGTDKADSLKDSKAAIETSFYEWLTEDLTEEELEGFLTTLDKLYWKSKNERRAGFENVLRRF